MGHARKLRAERRRWHHLLAQVLHPAIPVAAAPLVAAPFAVDAIAAPASLSAPAPATPAAATLAASGITELPFPGCSRVDHVKRRHPYRLLVACGSTTCAFWRRGR